MQKVLFGAPVWIYRVLFASLLAIALSACGGGGGNEPPATSSKFTIGGTISGLTSGTLVLQDNGADDLTLTSVGSFIFPTALSTGDVYQVTIHAQPAGQICTVARGAGTVSNANVTSVQINCSGQSSTVRRIQFLSDAQTVNVGSASGAISINAVDNNSGLVPLVSVALSSSSASMTFSLTPDFSTTTNSLALTSGTATRSEEHTSELQSH